MPTRRSTRSRATRLVGAATALLALTATGGSAVGDDGRLPDPSLYALGGTVTSTQLLDVKASKLSIVVPQSAPLRGLIYYNERNACPGPTGGRPVQCRIDQTPTISSGALRVGWPFAVPPGCSITAPPDAVSQYVRSGLVFTSVKPGKPVRADRIGELATLPVRLLTFGFIPATATLRMSMVEKKGKPVPWLIQLWNGSGVRCASGEDQTRTLIEGQADVQVTDLRIDGKPVDLGPNCRTERPVDIALWGGKGYGALAGGTASQYAGAPKSTGNIIPLRSPGYPERLASVYGPDEGRMIPSSTGVTVPPFVGCGVDEDLSPLITMTSSGEGFPLVINQARTTTNGIDLDNLDACDLAGCPAVPEDPVRPQVP